MPNTGLKGSYTLDKETIDRVITRRSPGTYVLCRVYLSYTFSTWECNIDIVHYVGRSDNDVNGTLKYHVGKYPRFKFDYFDSPKPAFEKECTIWHDFGGPEGKLDNKAHPDRSKGTDWKCPRCNTFD